MQFDYNDDYPPPPEERPARSPGQFPRPVIDQCERQTNYVLVNGRIQVLKNIIIPIINDHHNVRANASAPAPAQSATTGAGRANAGSRSVRMRSARGFGGSDDESECSYRSSDDEDYAYDDDEYDEDEEMMDRGGAGSGGGGNGSGDHRSSSHTAGQQRLANRAYLLTRSLREAIYGQVWGGIILRRCTRTVTEEGVERTQSIWEATQERCAVKEMGLHQIMEERGSAEDPYKEVSAMQYLQRYHAASVRNDIDIDMERMNLDDGGRAGEEEDDLIRKRAQETMLDTHVMMPLDVLTDNQNLYCVMPFCDGGELFDTLEQRQKFPEEEARYWFKQVLDGVETLQKAGICHRDMSLENLLTDSAGRALIIDLGMCLKIPYLEDEQIGGGSSANDVRQGNRPLVDPVDHRTRQRCLFKADRPCGKPYYMANEILENKNFDGHAVDMWALGPLLFLMVCGFPPWEQASVHDQRFYYFSNGHFVQTVRSWNLGLSEDLIDLLQRMFFRDPSLRLSLNQVRAHPWMSGPVAPPPNTNVA